MDKNKHYHKSVNFKHNDVNDMKLYEELKKMPHGEFSKTCKELLWDYIRRNVNEHIK